MRRGTIGVAVLAMLVAAGQASAARAEAGDQRIRFGLLYSSPLDDLTQAGVTTAELDAALGFQGSYEYLVTDLVGIEPGFNLVNHDVEVPAPTNELGDVEFFALTVGLNFHLVRKERFDLYFGPVLGYAFWGDLKTDLFPQDFATEDEFIYGATVGVDVPIGQSRWSFSGAASYLLTDLRLEGSSMDIGVDPFQIKAGASVHF